jgi:3-hydroxybutyrate dehydrogenase/3-oxoacyl-[acyl-carrier protein] reductase
VVNGRSEAKGQEALAEMGAGDRVHFVAGDVMQQGGVRGPDRHHGVALRPHRHPRGDTPAGATDLAPVAQLTDEAMEEALAWNYWHTFWTMRRALRHMSRRARGGS